MPYKKSYFFLKNMGTLNNGVLSRPDLPGLYRPICPGCRAIAPWCKHFKTPTGLIWQTFGLDRRRFTVQTILGSNNLIFGAKNWRYLPRTLKQVRTIRKGWRKIGTSALG